MVNKWFKLDAQNRAWRTVLQGLAVTVLLPAGDAALQVLLAALGDGSFDWGRTGRLAATSALTAAVMALAAYVHRLKLDPAAIPSAEPPRPAGVSAAQAPATTPTLPTAAPVSFQPGRQPVDPIADHLARETQRKNPEDRWMR